MVGYLSIFATLGLAVFCTEGGAAYTASPTCQDIGLPLLQKLDAVGAATCVIPNLRYLSSLTFGC